MGGSVVGRQKTQGGRQAARTLAGGRGRLPEVDLRGPTAAAVTLGGHVATPRLRFPRPGAPGVYLPASDGSVSLGRSSRPATPLFAMPFARTLLGRRSPPVAFAVALALLAWTSTPCMAQDGGEGSAAPASADANEAAAQAWILRLRNGDVVRGRARRANEDWEVAVDRSPRTAWRRIVSADVLKASLEQDLLRDAKRLEHLVATAPRAEQTLRRVGLADWLRQQGLVAESLAQLDRVLTAEPDQVQALALFAQMAPGLSSPSIDAALDAQDRTLSVLRAAANGTRTMRELAVQRLAFGGATDGLRAELRGQLTSHSPRLRSLAVLAMRRIYGADELQLEEVNAMIQRSVLDGAEDVRHEAARALRDVGDVAVAAPALRALGSTNARLRENSIEALSLMAYPATVEPLVRHLALLNSAQSSGGGHGYANPRGSIFIGKQTAYIQDFDVEVANSASIADPQVNVLVEGAVLDARVLGTYVVSGAAEARRVRAALGEITGVQLPDTNRAWLAWWEANKDRWNAPRPTTPGSTTTVGGERVLPPGSGSGR